MEMNFIVSGLLSYKNLFFSFILLSSNSFYFLSLLSGPDRQNKKMEADIKVFAMAFFYPHWMPPKLLFGYFLHWALLFCVLAIQNQHSPLQVPAGICSSVWDLFPETTSSLVYCLLNIMRVIKPTPTCCLTHHPCFSTHHVQAILTTC